MLYQMARLLQFAGMVILPIAIAGEVAGKVAFKDSLSLSAVGILAFAAGWLLQQMVKPK